jgi:hypothetical protein
MNRPDSMTKNVPKIAELKLSSCGLEVADFRKNYDCGIAELRLRSNISLKVAELRLRKCFLQVAEMRLWTQKKVARAHLWYIVYVKSVYWTEPKATCRPHSNLAKCI